MTAKIELLDLVAVTAAVSGEKNGVSWRNSVFCVRGTVVEILAPGMFEVEFSDNEGRTYAQAALHSDQLMALHIQPEAV